MRNRTLILLLLGGAVTALAWCLGHNPATLGRLDQAETSALVRDACKVPEYLSILARSRTRKQELNAKLAASHDLMARKERLGRDVLAGRLTLRQAAARFWEAAKAVDYPWDHYADSHPEWPREVRCGHYLIDQIIPILEDEGKDATPTVAKLWAEVKTWQEQH
jgi:hypothetical protein